MRLEAHSFSYQERMNRLFDRADRVVVFAVSIVSLLGSILAAYSFLSR